MDRSELLCNFIASFRCAPIFRYEFWSGNNEIFDEHSREVNRITRYEQTHLYAKLGENEFLHEKMQSSREFCAYASSPLRYDCLAEEWLRRGWARNRPGKTLRTQIPCCVRFLIAWNAIALLGVILGLARLYLRQRVYFVPRRRFPDRLSHNLLYCPHHASSPPSMRPNRGPADRRGHCGSAGTEWHEIV